MHNRATAAAVCAVLFLLSGCLAAKEERDLRTGLSVTDTSAAGIISGGTDTETGAGSAAEKSPATSAETIAIYEPAPLTAAEISALPAGTPVAYASPDPSIVDACFFYEAVSDEVFSRMQGRSYNDACTVPLSDLCYVRVLYVGFDGRTYIGELVVGTLIADDIIAVFRELYDAGYKIGKMVLVDAYDAVDDASVADNNTSAFNYRTVAGSTTLSKHALGLAVDMNPLYNPWVEQKDGGIYVDPPESAAYADRSLDCEYYISHDDLCFILFTEHGFIWGGDWKEPDYQHFQKSF